MESLRKKILKKILKKAINKVPVDVYLFFII